MLTRTDVPQGQVGEIQRSRLMAGAVAAIDELGYAQTTVAHITERSRVSRRTFYETFADREACLAAVLEQAIAMVQADLAAAELQDLPWRAQIRAGLCAILAFLDREPALARVCVVQALGAGQRVLARREQVLAKLTAAVDEGRRVGARGEACTPLTAEGVVGAAFAIIHARLQRGRQAQQEQLNSLLGELVGMIVLPYLGAAAARREQLRPAPTAVRAEPRVFNGAGDGDDPLRHVPMRLTYRTARVLEGIAELGRQGEASPSNRQVAERAGVSDPGQISKLLRRLERIGLLTNTSAGHAKGEPNAWTLTAQGARVAQSIRMHNSHQREAA
jgi:AcrR family transcriptional regulator